jgi:hypothetical protein
MNTNNNVKSYKIFNEQQWHIAIRDEYYKNKK